MIHPCYLTKKDYDDDNDYDDDDDDDDDAYIFYDT
jgi:hypothetical protein